MPEPPFQNQHPANPPTRASGSFTGASASASAGLLTAGIQHATLSISSIIIPERLTEEGILVRSTSIVWNEIVQVLGNDWTVAYQIPPNRWEEIVAGAFVKAGYEVELTRRSRDFGRDVIAVRRGVGCVKIIGSVKRYDAGNLVDYDDIRALIGVLTGEQDASKGIITTTSDFPPRVNEDKFIRQFLPTRLELMNGQQLRAWLLELARIDKT